MRWFRRSLDVEMVILGGITAAILLIVIAPIVMVVIISFTTGETLEFPPPGWGLRWYRSVIAFITGNGPGVGSVRFIDSIVTTLAIAVTVAVLAVAIGVPASYALVRFDFPGKLAVEQMISLSLVFPHVVLGIALLVLISRLRLNAGFASIVTSHVIVTFPFVVRNCTASLKGLNVSLEEAAWTLGASWWQGFAGVILPLIKQGILAGGLLAFIYSFNEFTMSYFLYTVDVVPFPIWLFSRSNTSLDPTIFALASGVIVFDVILIWLLDRVIGKRSLTF